MEKSLRRAGLSQPIRIFTDGGQACDYLRLGQTDESADGIRPLLIVVDLNMPRLDGYQVLRRIRSDQRTCGIPVAVLTSSDDEWERERCYRLGCDFHLVKPVDQERFRQMIGTLERFVNAGIRPEGLGQ